MQMKSGFRSLEHEAAFRDANHLVRRGGQCAAACGARTRTGVACQNAPIREGKGRCLRHAGPKAAREHREHQRRQFFAGKISAAEWNKAEARRAANRLGWEWKKNPWVPGSTIDLAAMEAGFRRSTQAFGVAPDALAPAVADWLRWRFKRTQIDRQNERAWIRVLSVDLPDRIRKAGVRPDTYEESRAAAEASQAPAWRLAVSAPESRSKRHGSDLRRAPGVSRGKGYTGPGRPPSVPPGDEELGVLMALYRAHRTLVAPLMGRCASEGGRMAVLRALRGYLAAPGERAPRERWLALVMRLGAT